MKNPSVPKERNMLKGAIMRVFSRSELRRKIIDKSIIVGHVDLSRPRVKKWCRCSLCKKPEAYSYMEVDHILPKVPLSSKLEDMSWDELVDNTWCDETNLQALCPECHSAKTKFEAALRKKYRNEKRSSNS